jgi:hypothetical protein
MVVQVGLGEVMYQYPNKPRKEPTITIEGYHFWFNEGIFGHGKWYYRFIPGQWLVYHAGRWEKMMSEEWIARHKHMLDDALTDWTIEKELLGGFSN